MNARLDQHIRFKGINFEVIKSRQNSLIALAVMLAFAVAATAILFPRHVTPETAAADRFSGERAMQHLPIIASEPHPAGSPAQARVRDYLLTQLQAINQMTELQKVYGADNVMTRFSGTASTGAIIILAHYDSVYTGPGAADNGSGTAALLEIARALSAGPALNNDIIVLFDDGEELPDMFTGSRAFVRDHPWMQDVRMAISMDTAVAGPISTCETGQDNGVLIQAMARTYTDAAWTSFGSGGGGYDSAPFRDAGIMSLALEDNYPFKEKHTDQDVVGIVRAGSVQQMGEQVLSLARELGGMDLSQPRAAHQTYFPLPFILLVHYPESWTVPLFLIATLLMIALFVLAFRRKLITWRSLLLAFGVILAAATLAALLISVLTPALPSLFGWDVNLWPDWPEVIPPNGIIVYAGFVILTSAVAVTGYRLVRRKAMPADISLAILIVFWMISAATAFVIPSAAYAFVWPVLIGSLAWLVTLLVQQKYRWPIVIPATLTALPLIFLLMPFIPGIVLADGMKSVVILGAVWVLILYPILAAIDQLVFRQTRPRQAAVGMIDDRSLNQRSQMNR